MSWNTGKPPRMAMALPRSPDYSPLKQEESLAGEGSIGSYDEVDRPRKARCTLRELWLPGLLVLLIALFSFVLGFMASLKIHAPPVGWSAELSALQTYPNKFDGAFDTTSKFRGPPGPEIDAEFARFTAHPLSAEDGSVSLLSVTEEDIRRSNKTGEEDWFNSTVTLGEANGGGYMASLELFHQMHCVNTLRMAVHPKHYPKFAPKPDFTYDDDLRTHLDHCVEIVRQVVTCNADTTMISFHWVKNRLVPQPDMNTWHQCRDPGEVLAWAKANKPTLVERVNKENFPDRIEMPHPPHP